MANCRDREASHVLNRFRCALVSGASIGGPRTCDITRRVIHSPHDPLVQVQGDAGPVRGQAGAAFQGDRSGRRAKARATPCGADFGVLAVAAG